VTAVAIDESDSTELPHDSLISVLAHRPHDILGDLLARQGVAAGLSA
jgi:hypothetical protein